MPIGPGFAAASRAAETWLDDVRFVADFGRAGNTHEAYLVLMPARRPAGLPNLLDSLCEHEAALREALDDLAVVADQGVSWPHGCGRSAVAPGVDPHSWRSAHQAALGLAGMAVELLVEPIAGITDRRVQVAEARRLLAAWWPAFDVPGAELSRLRMLIGRERARARRACPPPPARQVAPNLSADEVLGILRAGGELRTRQLLDRVKLFGSRSRLHEVLEGLRGRGLVRRVGHGRWAAV